MSADAFDPAATLRALEEAVASVVVGQDEVVRRTVACLVGGGHALLEGAPGLGKTLLVRTLAAATGLAFGRVQFTPDLLPADVTGTTILVDAPEGRRFEFRPGPLFAHLVLADEVNRATPRTQSALLEAMAEGAVTVAGERHPLPQPFCVLATQNPVEMEGTFPLPEAQLDRFLAKIVVPAPDEAALVEVFRRGATPPAPPVVATPAHVLAVAEAVRAVAIPEPLLRQVARIVRATDPRGAASTSAARRHLRLGASPRGGEAICRLAQVEALRAGRAWVEASDLAGVVRPALRHRLLPSFEAEARGLVADALVAEVLHDLTDLPPEVEAVLRAVDRSPTA
ncbi:MAG: AAA family ATPase [Planctomycetia bacterium]|nr:AAA family ATPase [Planctomycetia bacterium]